jgi:hypothetical protein
MSLVVTVLPSDRMEELGFHWTDFREILYLSIRKYAEKIPSFLKG